MGVDSPESFWSVFPKGVSWPGPADSRGLGMQLSGRELASHAWSPGSIPSTHTHTLPDSKIALG